MEGLSVETIVRDEKRYIFPLKFKHDLYAST